MEQKIDLLPYLDIAKKVSQKQVFGVFLFGSQNYNLDDEHSDIDVLCIIMPPSADSPIVVSSEMILDNQERIKFVDIREFVQELRYMLLPNLEAISTKYYLINVDYALAWEYLRNNLDVLAYSDERSFIIGTQAAIQKQYDGYFQNLGNQKIYQKAGYSAKVAQHTIRYCEILNKYLRKEPFDRIFYTDFRELLLSIKRGEETPSMVDFLVKFYYEQSRAIILPPSQDPLIKEKILSTFLQEIGL